MPERSTSRPLRALLAMCTTAVVGLISIPAIGHAAPNPSLATVQKQVGDLYHTAEQATERYNDARIELQAAERRFAQAQRRVAAQQAELSKMQTTVGAFAIAAYRSGGVDESVKLLFADDPDQFLERAAALNAVSERQSAELSRAVAAKQDLQADQSVAATQLAVVEAARNKLATEKKTIETNLRKAQQLLNSLQDKERDRLQKVRASRDSTERVYYSGPASGRARIAIDYAMAQIGDPYRWGAAGPDAWDCSGLTMVAWRKAGVSLPHSSRMQYDGGRKVSRSSLQPGDLVYFYSPISHVGIYIGGGKMVHAPNPSERVKVDPISYMPYSGATRP